eukprot:UN15678
MQHPGCDMMEVERVTLDDGQCEGGSCKGVFHNNHDTRAHTFVSSSICTMSPADLTFDITGFSGHSHTVQLGEDDLMELRNGLTITVTSTTDSNHSHDISIRCQADECPQPYPTYHINIYWYAGGNLETCTWLLDSDMLNNFLLEKIRHKHPGP